MLLNIILDGEERPEARGRELENLLMSPVQMLPRYALFLGRLRKTCRGAQGRLATDAAQLLTTAIEQMKLSVQPVVWCQEGAGGGGRQRAGAWG